MHLGSTNFQKSKVFKKRGTPQYEAAEKVPIFNK
jgi:hypothetical protein